MRLLNLRILTIIRLVLETDQYQPVKIEDKISPNKRIQTDLAYGQTVDAERNVSFIEIDKAQDVFNFQKNEVS